MSSRRWVKISEPGQFRGEGNWTDFDTLRLEFEDRDEEWNNLVNTGFLPTYYGENPNV